MFYSVPRFCSVFFILYPLRHNKITWPYHEITLCISFSTSSFCLIHLFYVEITNDFFTANVGQSNCVILIYVIVRKTCEMSKTKTKVDWCWLTLTDIYDFCLYYPKNVKYLKCHGTFIVNIFKGKMTICLFYFTLTS